MDSVVVCAAVFVGLGFLTFVSGKDASTQTTERLTMLEELKNMEVIDYIRAGALCIGLVAPLIHGKKTWLMALILGAAARSLGDFFFPQQVLSHITRTEIDVVHQYLLQVIAVVSFGRLATIYQTWESRDPGVSTSILVTSAVGTSIMTIASVFDYNKWQNRFAPQYLTLALFPTILAAFGCIVYIFRGSAFGKGNLDFRGRVSRHILIDVMVLFAASFFYFGYPDVPLANVVLKGFKADGVHYHLIRKVGVVMFFLALSGFMALGFQNEKDQQAYLFGRVVTLATMCPLVGLYQWKYHIIDFGSNIGMLVFSAAVAGNVLCGYFNLQWPKVKRN